MPSCSTEAAEAFYPYVVNGEGTAQEDARQARGDLGRTLKTAGYPAE